MINKLHSLEDLMEEKCFQLFAPLDVSEEVGNPKAQESLKSNITFVGKNFEKFKSKCLQKKRSLSCL